MRKRPLLYIDLLGFGDFVLTHDHESVKNYYARLLRDLRVFHRGNSRSPLKMELVSDSAFFWVDDANLDRSFKLLAYVAHALLHNGLMENEGTWAQYGFFTPMRGTLCFEEFEIGRNNIFLGMRGEQGRPPQPVLQPNFTILGKAIVMAAKWEQCQDWIGISIPGSNVELIRENVGVALNELVSGNFLIEFDVPLKERVERTFAINPLAASGRHHSGLTNTLDRAISEAKEVTRTRKYVRSKEFLEHIISNGLNKDDPSLYIGLRQSYQADGVNF